MSAGHRGRLLVEPHDDALHIIHPFDEMSWGPFGGDAASVAPVEISLSVGVAKPFGFEEENGGEGLVLVQHLGDESQVAKQTPHEQVTPCARFQIMAAQIAGTIGDGIRLIV